MGSSSLRVGFLFTACFLTIAVMFQNCDITGDKGVIRLDQGSGAANLNGTPYTGMQPKEGTYYALGFCAGGNSQKATTQIEVSEGSSKAFVTDSCSQSTKEIDVQDLFYRSYSENYLSYDSAIFQYIEDYSDDQIYDKAQFVCWLGPGNGGTASSGINLVLKDSSQFIDYIITGDFSDSGQRQVGTLIVDSLNPVESGPEAGWIFVESADYVFIITDTLNERGLYTATFEGKLESKNVLYEFDCQKQF